MIIFRHADDSDLAIIAEMLYEVEIFYGTTEFPDRAEWENQVASLLFGDTPAGRVILALDSDVALGFASYSFLWPAAGVTKSMFLKELYVREKHRRQGLGVGLMSHLCTLAIESGSSRLEWATDRENQDAQSFYRRLGFVENPSKILYRAQADDLVRLSELSLRQNSSGALIVDTKLRSNTRPRINTSPRSTPTAGRAGQLAKIRQSCPPEKKPLRSCRRSRARI